MAIATALLVMPAAAQSLEQVARQYREDQELLRRYTWKSKVRFTIDGVEKSSQLFQVRLGVGGNLERTLAETDRKGKEAKSLSEAESSLTEIRSLIDGYMHMSPENFAALFKDATVRDGEGPDEGLTRIQARGVVALDDLMSVWVDTGSSELRRFEIATSRQRVPVEVVAQIDRIEGGPRHASQVRTRTSHKKKVLVIETENFDYQRLEK
jgi:hypothetical protein